MSTRGLKKAGFTQALFQTNAVAQERIGTLRVTQDGRMFRYAKAAATQIEAGILCACVADDADVVNTACNAAHAIGDVVIAEEVVSTSKAENYYKGGFFYVNDATGQGHQYSIESSSVLVAGTSIILTLNDPIRVALVASTSEFTIGHHPLMDIVIQATVTDKMAGVAPMVIPASHWFWIQTHGECVALSNAAAAIGTIMSPGTTNGSVDATTTALDVDLEQIGYAFGSANVTGEYQQIFLQMD